MVNNKMVNNKLKSLRIEKGLNQSELAEELKITLTSYSRKENGLAEFTQNEIMKLINLLGTTFEEMFLHESYSNRN